MGQWEGYSHQASLIIVDHTLDIKVIIEMILPILQQQDEIEFGLSEPNVNGLVIRLLGYKGEQLYKCLQQIAGLVTAIIEKKMQPHVA